MPFCSVIIPTYNRALFLKEAVDSVLAQDFKDFELIVVDDGSTDETQKILAPYLEKNLLKVIVQKNKGVAAARNTGIKSAAADWLAFLDSDDLWLPKKLEKQINFLRENPNLKICQTEEIWIRRGVRVNPMKKHQKFSGWIFKKCLPLCLVSPSAVMIHRDVFEAVGFFDESFLVCEDYEFWLRVSLNLEIGLLDEPLIIKRGGHPDQLSQKFPVMDKFRIRAMEKIWLAENLSLENKKVLLENLRQKCRIVAAGALKRGRWLTAFNYQRKLKKLDVPQESHQ